MKKIAIIDHVGSKAGMDYYSSSLLKGLLPHGCKTFLYSNFIGIESDKINYRPYFEGHTNANSLIKLLRLLKATFKASFNARKEGVDLIILHLFYANFITLLLIAIPKLLGLRTAIISHDVSSFVDNDTQFVQNLIYNYFSDFIIVHNQFSLDSLYESINIHKPEKVVIIKHGGSLDHIKFKPEKERFRSDFGLEKDGKYVLFFGQIKKVKGLDVLLRAMALVSSDVKLIIAGKPLRDDFKMYDDLITENSLENRVIKLIRFIEDDEREKLFFAADVNALPYRIIYQSGVLLMAMSHGLPVIASDLPANKEIIVDGFNGLLFKNEDPVTLAQQINHFFTDRDLQKKLAENALVTIRSEYDWDDIGHAYINLIEN